MPMLRGISFNGRSKIARRNTQPLTDAILERMNVNWRARREDAVCDRSTQSADIADGSKNRKSSVSEL